MTTGIDEQRLTEGLTRRGLDGEEGQRALRATLAVLGERLVDDEARMLASWLPRPLAKLVEDADYDTSFGSNELFVRVARRMKTSPGRALEGAEVVLASLGEALGTERAKRLARALPETAAELVLGVREMDRSAAPAHDSRSGAPRLTTLASGRPGSRRPLCEGRASPGQRNSVAVDDEPHAETKLSSAHGTTQERLRETLAEGQPPRPTRALGDAKD